MNRRIASILTCALLATGCPGGGGNHHDPDGRPPDAPITASGLIVDGGSGPVTAWTFADTHAGAKAEATLLIKNAGTAAIGPLAATIAGDPDFTLIASGTDCEGKTLAMGSQCQIRLAFAPTATGARTASLHIAAGADAPLELPLHGNGLPALPAGLVASVSSLDFASVELDQHADADVILSNTSTAPIALGTRTVTTGYTIVGDNCPTSLSAGGTCKVTLRFTPTASGMLTGTFTAPWTGDDVTVALTGIGLRRITVERIGGGTGTITSSPAGLDCGATCSALFLGDVTLTATPDAQNVFGGWDAPCGADATCTLPAAGGSIAFHARFEKSNARQVAVTFAGAARGIVFVLDGSTGTTLATCNASCTTVVATGTQVLLEGYTPSSFTGWTGACTTTEHECNLGTVVADRAATVTFDPDEREVATLFLSSKIAGLAIAPDGNPIVADAAGVTKRDLTGAAVWTAPITGGARDLATDAAGNVYGLGGPGVFALSPAGAPLWTRAFEGGSGRGQSIDSDIASSPDGTVIAVLTADGVHVVDGAGVDRFTVTGLLSMSVAVAPDGTVAVGVPHPGSECPDCADALRYASSGTALAPAAPLPGHYDVSLAYDALGYVAAVTTGFSTATVSRTAPDLITAFAKTESTDAAAATPAGVVVDSAGEIVAVRDAIEMPVPGVQIEVFSPTGTITWTHLKTPTEYFAPTFDDGVVTTAIAAGGPKRIVLAGTYGNGQPWIQIYAMP